MTVEEFIAKFSIKADHAGLDKLQSQLQSIKQHLTVISAIEVGRTILDMTERFSHFADELNATAFSAGISAERLQQLQFSAEQAGASADEVGGGMARLSRMLSEARQGSEQAAESFARAGITPEELATYRTGADALEGLADHMAQMTDPVEKTGAAMALMGRGSADMVKWLSLGGKGIREVGQDAAALGAIVSQQNIDKLEELEDTMSGFLRVIKAFSATIAAAFAPSIRDAVRAIEDWWKANRQLITTSIEEWAYKLLYTLGFVTEGFVVAGEAFWEFIKTHKELVKQLGEFALAIGAVIALGEGLGIFLGLLKSFAAGASTLNVALAAAALAGHAFYEMLGKGKQFEDTLLAKLLLGDSAKNFADILKWAGFVPDTNDYQIDQRNMVVPKRPGDATLPGPAIPNWWKLQYANRGALRQQGGGLLDSDAQDMIAAGSSFVTPRMQAEQAAAAAEQLRQLRDLATRTDVAGDPSRLVGAPYAVNLPPSSVTINAPLTVNAPPGVDAETLHSRFREAVDQQLGAVARQAARATEPAVRY